MDSSSSSSKYDVFHTSIIKDSSSSSSKYDVFLSFRSEDTRKTFVSHLYRALVQKGIRTYKDENQETRDGRISPQVALAIKESKIAVVVISENYASSAWCLGVLAEIIESSMVTKAVFYEVDPGDWRRPADEFRTHEEEKRPVIVDRWKDALDRLESAADRRFCSRNWDDDSKMLDELIMSISSARNTTTTTTTKPVILPYPRRSRHTSKKTVHGQSRKQTIISVRDADSKHIPKNTSLVGMGRHKKTVYELLDLEYKNQVRVIGIWGMEGVGKTTLAESVFEDISRHFQHHFFLTNVHDIHQNRISQGLLEHLTRTRPSNVGSFDAIKPSLINRNLLLVVDGVHDIEQLKDIVKVSHWLGPGSRVIVTSKDVNSLVSCGIKYVHEVECLRYEEALQLFCLFAFDKTSPLIGFERFSVRAVHFTRRVPLSLKVLGSFLHGKEEESWKSTLCRLEASQDKGTRAVSSYIGACEYPPRHQTELERYVRAEQEEHSPSYYMLL